MSPRHGKQIRPVTPRESRAHLAQAEEYLRAAEDALSHGHNKAATGNAVTAAVNAADAVTGAVLGNRWSGDHGGSVAHVQTAGDAGRQIAKHLRTVLPLKSAAQYGAEPISPARAKSCVTAARRAVEIARRIASGR